MNLLIKEYKCKIRVIGDGIIKLGHFHSETISTARTPINPPDPSSHLDRYLEHYIRIQYRCNKDDTYQSNTREKWSDRSDSHNDTDEADGNEKNLQSKSGTVVGKEQKRMRIADKKMPLTKGTRVNVGEITHFKYPNEREDLRASMEFVTIPSFESREEFLITKAINLTQLVEERNKMTRERNTACNPGEGIVDREEHNSTNNERSSIVPEPGDIYDVYLTGECHIYWWNWGDVRCPQTSVTKPAGSFSSPLYPPVTSCQKFDSSDSRPPNDTSDHRKVTASSSFSSSEEEDISTKKFVLLPNSVDDDADLERYRRMKMMLHEEHSDWLPDFRWSMELEDEEGNEMVYLDVDVDNGVCLTDSSSNDDDTGFIKRNIGKPRDGHRGFNAEVKQGRSRFQLEFD